mmetsp:Transcript_35469/g.35988  ORF Transcript_35469/g.35988 Transcript_35469/m.35988 type:complete len:284 (+) Transcript_35469:818-1669(+)
MIEGIYEAAKKSLLNNLERIVRPINDNEYSDCVDQYHMVLDFGENVESNDYSDNDDQDREKGSNNEEEEEEEEEEVDEEELIDMKALKNAQELRTRIRNMSSTVQTIRERVLKRTEHGISSSVSAHLIDRPIKIVFEDDDKKEDIGISHTEDSGDASNNKENIVNTNINSQNNNSKINTASDCISSCSLQDSLEGLSQLLRDPQWTRLPNRIQLLQGTIETIQKETAENRFMSQTEIAITSQCKDTIVNESSRNLLEEISGEEGEESNIDAIDRLVLLGQLFS